MALFNVSWVWILSTTYMGIPTLEDAPRVLYELVLGVRNSEMDFHHTLAVSNIGDSSCVHVICDILLINRICKHR